MRISRQGFLVTLIASCVFPLLSMGAEISGPITSGAKGDPFSAPTFDITSHGYVVEEYFLDGDAHAVTRDSVPYAIGSHHSDVPPRSLGRWLPRWLPLGDTEANRTPERVETEANSSGSRRTPPEPRRKQGCV